MEVVGNENAVAVCIDRGSKTVLGRGSNTPPSFTDSTVSRSQVALELQNTSDRVFVEVLGTNPICILRCGAGAEADSSPEFLKRGESIYVEAGDKFSLSVKNPHFFTLKKKQRIERDAERKHIQFIDFSLDPSDLSRINRFAEFGFLVEGSEFEQYRKRCINDVNRWDWHLSNESEKSTDDENVAEDGKGSRSKTKKKKGAKATKGDVDWTGESEEEKEQINKFKIRKNSRPFKARSKSSRRDTTSNASKLVTSKRVQLDDSIDDDDDTLGGFIVDDSAETADDEDEDEDELSDDDFDEEDESEVEMGNDTRKGSSSRKRKP